MKSPSLFFQSCHLPSLFFQSCHLPSLFFQSYTYLPFFFKVGLPFFQLIFFLLFFSKAFIFFGGGFGRVKSWIPFPGPLDADVAR